MQISQDKAGVIRYTVKDTNGEVLDSTDGKAPLAYVHGYGTLLPGLERALEGKSAGDRLTLTIPPEDAYGEHNEDLLEEAPISNFGDREMVKPGARFKISTDKGECLATIKEVNGETVTVDFNNILAGKTLEVDAEVVEVREATNEELARSRALYEKAVDELSH